jgi:hypothetical protein
MPAFLVWLNDNLESIGFHFHFRVYTTILTETAKSYDAGRELCLAARAMRSAQFAPTLPAPTTVAFFRTNVVPYLGVDWIENELMIITRR